MRTTKVLSILYLVLVFVFAMRQTAYSDECRWTGGTVSPNLIWGEPCYSCPSAGFNTYCKSTGLIRLDTTTGAYKVIGIFPKKCNKSSAEAVSFPANIAIMDNNGAGLSYNVVSLSTMKIVGKITVDVSPGTNPDDSEAYIIISPDGSRIFVEWQDGKDYTPVTEVFDGRTYKKITKYSPSLVISSFSNDGKYAYLIGLKKDWNIPVLDLSTMQMSKAIPLPDTMKGMIEGNQFESNIVFYKYKPPVSYIYNIDTRALSVSIPTHEDCDNSYLSPKASWLLCKGKNQIDAYNTSTGKWAAMFTTTGKGAIISWADDHTFIYNTTQKLIYFNILKNKIVKELPIIRPWKKKGWKPKVK